MKRLSHEMILASAGSGKTYALTNRFVELLAWGAVPERIVALTFTRKAAGEFFDEILNKLARAAGDPAIAKTLATQIRMPELRESDFLRMLRSVADSMHRLRLGTLDSFFARVARAFPFELGLEGEFELLEDFGARLERQRVLQRMFSRTGELATAQKDFIEAFKRATFGGEEKQLAPKLDAFLDDHQERYLQAPDAVYWGDAARIWPRGNSWISTQPDREAALGVLTRWLDSAPIGDKQRVRWRNFFAAISDWAPGIQVSREIAYVLEKAVAIWPAVLAGSAVLEFDRKKQELSREACGALAAVTTHVIGGELRRHLATTRGIHSVLRHYDVIYHDTVRRAGRLTFGDVQRLLLPDSVGGALSRQKEGDGRLFVDYRLDAEIDHWLLDEFQDTSFGQWSVLKNLVDEVVQDTSGTRSFFCVGDVKQAIFTWREGDPRLFREIFEHYNAGASGSVSERRLADSWRSGPAVIAMVNAVFGNAAVLRELFPGAAAENWIREWRDHVSAVPSRIGQTAVVLAEDEGDRWRRVVQLLHEIRPLERGLTCAVLVPKNSIATELAEFIRSEGGIPAVAESDLHVCGDNPVGAALLALAKSAAHPGDTMAWEHVTMSPLRAALEREGIRTQASATMRLLDQIHAQGFERTMEFWFAKLEAGLSAGDTFSRTRGRQFTAAAARFDRSGSRNVAEFLEYMERHVVRDPEGTEVVRVMTIHKSKGLGFDVVILPDMEGKRLDQRREGLAVQKAHDRTVEWILDLPPKLVHEADEVLAAHVRGAEADACYEALSLLYVACTRSKRATYVVLERVGKSVSRNYPKLLVQTLGDEEKELRVGALKLPAIWVTGESDWHVTLAAPLIKSATGPESLSPLAGAIESRSLRREPLRPSNEAPRRISAHQLFSLETRDGTVFGAEVHSLLAEVERGWTNALLDRWRRHGATTPAIAECHACLQAKALADIWTPARDAEIWRERAFELVIDNAWVSGVFDRVIVETDAKSGRRSIKVFDFKTDRVDDQRALDESVRRHSSQLNVYRRVAAVLADVPVNAVTCELVFTRAQCRLQVVDR